MKTTIQTIEFPEEIKKKLNMKVGMSNIDLKFSASHIIKFNNTNLSIKEPFKIIASNLSSSLIILFYDSADKFYLLENNIIISFTKLVNILNLMNKSK